MIEKKYNPKAIAKTIDVEELYDLDVTIARFILPRLMVFKSIVSAPQTLTCREKSGMRFSTR